MGKKSKTKRCCYCGSEFSAKRPYEHCTGEECVTAWTADRRSHMAIALLPKSGFTVVYKQDSKQLGRTTKG